MRSPGIYRVGSTIFTSAIICKTWVSFFSTNIKQPFLQPDFFVTSGFYLLQKRQAQRVAMPMFLHNLHSFSGYLNTIMTINIFIIISHDSPHVACVFISNRNGRLIITTLFFDARHPTTYIIRFFICAFNN